MSKRKPLLVLLVFISLLFGCNDNVIKTQFIPATKVQVDFTMLTSENTLPTNFEDIAFKQGTDTFLARKAVDQSEFDATWSLYELEQDKPDVDFNENVVFFIGVYESGCPSKIKSVELKADYTIMSIPLSVPDGPCTTIAKPRTFVIQLEKELTEKLEVLVIDDTMVPFE